VVSIAHSWGNFPDVLVLLVGRGILEPELRQRVKYCGLEENIRLLGFAADGDLPWM